MPRHYTDTAFLAPGMGVEEARRNGFKHGFQGKVSVHICTLTDGSAERQAWMEGYAAGESAQVTNPR